MFKITDPKIQEYVETWSEEEDPLLRELERITHLKTLSPGMLAGNMLGQFLSMICQLMQAKTILEIGTFTGYSTLVMAKSAGQGAKVYTIESKEEIVNIATTFFQKSQFAERIIQKQGDAVEIIGSINETFDLVFIDASKEQYSSYFDLVIDKIRPGGMIVADNVLWYGGVVEDKKKPKTQSIHEFNQKVKNDKRVQNILLPFGDGVNCILKR